MKSLHKARRRRPASAPTGSRRSPLAACASALFAITAIATLSRAANYYWYGDNASNAWNVTSGSGGTNWSSSGSTNQATAGVPGVNDDVYFAGTGAQTLTSVLGQNFSVNSVNFTPAATTAVSIGGANTLAIGAGGITDSAAAAGANVTISSAVQLGASQIWTNDSSNAFVVSGVIGSSSGANSLTLAGFGDVNFTAANTYTGDTTVFTGSLTLSGAGALASQNINLGAGTTLTLDNTGSNSNTRLASTASINSHGGIITLVGNNTSQTTGTLNVLSGATIVSVTGSGSTLTFGSDEGIPSLNRSVGGTVLFDVGSGANVSLPGLSNQAGGGLTNGIIGGWAFTGSSAGGNLNFATLSGDNVVPYTAYTQLTGANSTAGVNNPMQPVNNVKYDASASGQFSAEIQASATINSLYMTGGSAFSGLTGVPTTPTNTGSGGTYYNGITFGYGLYATDITLTIGSGGIISSGATGVGYFNNHSNIPNMAIIGNIFGYNAATSQPGYQGNIGVITAEIGTPDLVVYTDSNLMISANIADNGSQSVGLTKSGPGILDLSDGNVQNNKPVNSFTGPVTINEGVLLINAVGQLGASNVVNFNGGELRTYAGTIFSGSTWTVGTQGGILSYTGGNTTTVSNLITGVGGFTYFARADGAPVGPATILLSNTSGTGGGSSDNYQGPTSFLFSYLDGAAGAGSSNAVNKIIMNAPNQVPATSEVILNTVQDLPGYPVTPNNNSVALDLNSTSQAFGSIEGNVGLKNLNSGALTIGANNLSVAYTGVISGSGGGLVKVGSGTQTLSAANTFTGATSILGGKLLIGTGTGNHGAGSLAGAVTVGNGTLSGALGGNGTINGAVTINSTGILAPAMSPTTTNTLTIRNNLTINAGATFNYNLGALGTPGAGDLVLVSNSGTITIKGDGTVPDVININALSGFGIGTYNLLTAGSAALITNPNGETFTVNGSNAFNYAVGITGSSLVLTVTAGSPILTWAGSSGNNTWVSGSGGSNVWTGSTTKYFNPDNVVFGDITPAHSAVTLNTAVTPTSVLFNGQTANYVISGTGSVAVATNVTQQGAANDTFSVPVTTPVTTVNGGTLTANAAYASTAKIDINNGTLVANSTLTTSQLNVNSGGVLTINSGGSIAAGTTLNLGANATVNFKNASQTLPAVTSVSSSIISLTGTNFSISNPTTFNGQFSGNGTLTHNNGGTLTLTNASPNFTGAVSVSGNSTLLVTNPSGSATGNASVTIASGSTLDGTGSIAGAVTIASGAIQQGTGTFGSTGGETLSGTLIPSGTGIGAITLGALTINSGAILNFDVTTASNDIVNVLGKVALSGTETFNINFPTTPALGSYTLLNSTGFTGSASFTVNPGGAGFGNLGANITYTIQQTPTALILNVLPPSVTWSGVGNGNWNYTDGNWSGANGSLYSDNYAAVFNDSGAHTNVTLTSTVSPTYGMLFSNSSVPYTFNSSSTANISGPGGVTLNGAGSVTLNGPNTFSGPAVINAGTLVISSDAAYGNDAGSLGVFPGVATPNSIIIASGGTLATTASFTLNGNRGIGVGAGATINVVSGTVLTYGGVIANYNGANGVLNKTGSGELALAGANTFTGGFNVNGGAVTLLTTTAAGTGPITVNNAGSTLVVSSGGGTTANAMTLGNGAILASGSNSETLSNTVAVASGASVAIDEYDPTGPNGTNRLNFTGAITGTNANITINNYPGANVPDAGSTDGVRFNVNSALSGTVTLGSAAKAVVTTSGTSGSPLGTANVVLTGGTNPIGQTGTYSTLNVVNNSGLNTTLGNNVSMVGTGKAYVNVSGAAGTTIGLGALTLSANQTLGVVSTSGNRQTASFTSLALNGNATLSPGISGNTVYSSAEDISVGAVTETSAGSGLTVNGTGKVTLRSAASYTGSTVVSGGTLEVNSTLGGTGVVVTHSTLAGTGTVNTAVTLGDNTGSAGSAVIRAGSSSSTGTFTVNGLVLDLESAFNFQVNISSGLFSMLKDTSGSLLLGNGLYPISFDDQGTGGTPNITVGQVFPIVQLIGGGTITGNFAGEADGSVLAIGADTFRINYNQVPGQVTLTVVTAPQSVQAAPEPGSLALLAGGGSLLGLGRFRRKKS